MTRVYNFQKILRKKVTENEAKQRIGNLLMSLQVEIEFYKLNTKNNSFISLVSKNEPNDIHIQTMINIEKKIMFYSQFLEKDCFIEGRFIQKMPLSDKLMDFLQKITKDEFKEIYSYKTIHKAKGEE